MKLAMKQGNVSVPTALVTITSTALIPLGLVGALFLHGLASGQEGLLRWQSITITNKNAMYFMMPILVALIGAAYYGRQETIMGRVLVIGVTLVGVIGSAYLRSIINPLGVSS